MKRPERDEGAFSRFAALPTGLLSLCPSGTIFRLLSLRSFVLRRRRGTTADRPRPIAQRCGDSSAAGPGPFVDAHGLKSGLSFLGPPGRIRRPRCYPQRCLPPPQSYPP
jgi:hypothetical protein